MPNIESWHYYLVLILSVIVMLFLADNTNGALRGVSFSTILSLTYFFGKYEGLKRGHRSSN